METQAAIGHYQIVQNTGRFTVQAFASGMLSALGHSPTIAIRDFSGDITFVPGQPGDFSMRMKIRADSLEVTDDISGKDRREIERMMNQEVLQVAQYPEIVFETASVSVAPIGEGRWQANLNGSLTLRDITAPQSVSTQVTVLGDMLRAGGEFTMLQSKYGIKPVSVAGGTLKLKDELKFTFDIVARKQE